MYYIWKNVGRQFCPEIKDYTHLEISAIASLYYTKGGLPLEKPLPEITFQVDTLDGLREMDSLWAGLPYLVFSPKLRAALDMAGVTNIEYYPARIKNRLTGEVISDYKIANIVGLVYCMDWEKATYTRDPDRPDRAEEITHLVIDATKIPDHLPLFRLGEQRTTIICNQRVQDTLIAEGITGVRFIEVDVATVDR